jgi:hypothetical protein
MSLFGLLLLGVVVVFVAMVTLKVFPTVTEYMAIKRAVQTASQESTIPGIRVAFDKAATIEDITALNGKDLQVQPAPNGGHHVSFGYEKRIPLFGPASLVLEYRGDTRTGR